MVVNVDSVGEKIINFVSIKLDTKLIFLAVVLIDSTLKKNSLLYTVGLLEINYSLKMRICEDD
jgi:hypothetical protein